MADRNVPAAEFRARLEELHAGATEEPLTVRDFWDHGISDVEADLVVLLFNRRAAILALVGAARGVVSVDRAVEDVDDANHALFMALVALDRG